MKSNDNNVLSFEDYLSENKGVGLNVKIDKYGENTEITNADAVGRIVPILKSMCGSNLQSFKDYVKAQIGSDGNTDVAEYLRQLVGDYTTSKEVDIDRPVLNDAKIDHELIKTQKSISELVIQSVTNMYLKMMEDTNHIQ